MNLLQSLGSIQGWQHQRACSFVLLGPSSWGKVGLTVLLNVVEISYGPGQVRLVGSWRWQASIRDASWKWAFCVMDVDTSTCRLWYPWSLSTTRRPIAVVSFHPLPRLKLLKRVGTSARPCFYVMSALRVCLPTLPALKVWLLVYPRLPFRWVPWLPFLRCGPFLECNFDLFVLPGLTDCRNH